MKFWLIERTDRCDYDEYDELVVRAESEEDALGCLYQECFYKSNGMSHHCWDNSCNEVFTGFKPDGSNARVTEVKPEGETGLVIGSFRAG